MSRSVRNASVRISIAPSLSMAALVACALTACATHVPQVLTPKIMPTHFGAQAERFAEDGPAEGVWPQQQWWRGFQSPELAELVATAATNNKDLAVAAARVQEAKAQYSVRRAAFFPQISAQAQAQRSSTGGSSGAPSGTSATSGGGAASGGNATSSGGGTSTTANAFGLNVDASYEVDLWGLTRANVHAANEMLKSARFAQQAAALTLTATVADAYFSILTLRERIAIANEDITAINSLLEVIKLRVSTGKSSHLDLAQEQAQIESVEAQLPGLEEQELESRVKLAVLLGQPPELLKVRELTTAAIQTPSVSPGLPSDLLLRRPDVAEAEADLASAHANLDAARAAFLPQFSLTSEAGYASTTIGALLRGPSFAWDAGANLLQTVFDGGKLIGQKSLAAATQQELIASYQSAVLNAYADVETALGQVKNNRKVEEHLMRLHASQIVSPAGLIDAINRPARTYRGFDEMHYEILDDINRI